MVVEMESKQWVLFGGRIVVAKKDCQISGLGHFLRNKTLEEYQWWDS